MVPWGHCILRPGMGRKSPLSDEMEPRWFRVEDFPYEDMWMADKVWLPMILSGKRIRGTIYFAEDGETVFDYDFQEMT